MKKRIRRLIFVICLFMCTATPCLGDGPVYMPPPPLVSAEDSDALPTVTVRGFLNFRTTVDGTVIVFTPASESAPEPSVSSVSPLDDVISEAQKRTELENEAHTPEDDRQNFRQRHQKPGLSDSTTEDSPRLPVEPPELPHHKPTQTQAQYPTGLVTVLGGTHVSNGATTVFETKVIGTYIEGKYAQILQSTSQIIFPAKPAEEELLSTPKPTKASVKVAPSSLLDLAPSRPNEVDVVSSSHYGNEVESKEYKTAGYNRQAERRTDEPLNANTVLQSSFKLPDSIGGLRTSKPTESLDRSPSRASYTLSRRFRPSPASEVPPEDENTVPEFQNSNGRQNLPRFRYVLPRRNSPSVRLNRFKVKLTVRNEGGASDLLATPHDNTFDPDDDLLEEYDPQLHPHVDPARVVFEKTTITSEVTLHVGRRKSVRTLTITTSVPKTRHSGYASADPLHDRHFDISPANNNAIFATVGPIDDEAPFPPQVVVTRTYTTTERMLKTSVVPVLENDTTSFHTVTESFFILKLITGYKTMPAGEMTAVHNESDADPDDTSDQELTGLLDGAVQLQPSPRQQIVQTSIPNGLLQASGSGREQAIVPYNRGNQMDLSNSLMSLGAALQQNPLAAVYLGLQQLNRQATLYSTITKTSTYIHTDTIYSTKVVSIYDGRRTRTRTLSESLSTTERTMTSLTTTVEPYLNTQLNQLQQLFGGTHQMALPPAQQFSTVTSTYTTVTTATSLSTRIYTLIYNALSTKFRTVTSTSLYETTVVATTTSEVPIAITAPPGGVFPFLG